MLLAAATCSKSTANILIGDVATFINETPTNRPLTDLYIGMTGE